MNGITLRGSILVLSCAQKTAISVKVVRSQPGFVLQGDRLKTRTYKVEPTVGSGSQKSDK